jgi:hypothetical protein
MGIGAPLSVEETKILEEIYPKVKPFYANKELLLSKRRDGKTDDLETY